jgi:hypothetical protein
VSPPDRWVDIVASELVKSYLDSQLSIVFVTRGISGETTRQGLERFHTPYLLTIQFGLNDYRFWAAACILKLRMKANCCRTGTGSISATPDISSMQGRYFHMLPLDCAKSPRQGAFDERRRGKNDS